MINTAIRIRIPNTLLIESDSASVSARNRMRPGSKKIDLKENKNVVKS